MKLSSPETAVLVPQPVAAPLASAGCFGDLDATRGYFGVAKSLATSKIVPKEYQGNDASCLIALDLALRMRMNPLVVMQNLYVVYNRPSWSGQFYTTLINACGLFSRLKFDVSTDGFVDVAGEKIPNDVCRARAVELATGEELVGPPASIKMAVLNDWYTKPGSKWQTLPELMLRYRAASFFGKTFCPDVTMGFQTSEELADAFDGEERPRSIAPRTTKTLAMSADAAVYDEDDETGESTANEGIAAERAAEFEKAILDAATPDALRNLGAEIARSPFDASTTARLRDAFQKRRDELARLSAPSRREDTAKRSEPSKTEEQSTENVSKNEVERTRPRPTGAKKPAARGSANPERPAAQTKTIEMKLVDALRSAKTSDEFKAVAEQIDAARSANAIDESTRESLTAALDARAQELDAESAEANAANAANDSQPTAQQASYASNLAGAMREATDAATLDKHVETANAWKRGGYLTANQVDELTRFANELKSKMLF